MGKERGNVVEMQKGSGSSVSGNFFFLPEIQSCMKTLYVWYTLGLGSKSVHTEQQTNPEQQTNQEEQTNPEQHCTKLVRKKMPIQLSSDLSNATLKTAERYIHLHWNKFLDGPGPGILLCQGKTTRLTYRYRK